MQTETGNNNGSMMPPSPPEEYIQWISAVRRMQDEARRAVVAFYDVAVRGRDAGTWKLGPWKSFEECLEHECGWHPKRFAHLEQAIRRFGRDWVSINSFESALPMLRLTPGSRAEREVMGWVAERNKENGRPPSPEAVDRLVQKYVPPARPVRPKMTEEDRLRAALHTANGKLREVEAELKTCRTKLKATEAALRKSEARVKTLESKKKK